jgi:hypothetical protein
MTAVTAWPAVGARSPLPHGAVKALLGEDLVFVVGQREPVERFERRCDLQAENPVPA